MFRSEYADVPAVELPIHEAVLGGAAAFGETPALIDGADGTTLTYAQVDRFHRRAAAALAEAGVRKGDVLALHSPNLSATEVRAYVAERVAPYKRVRRVTFVDAVPRAASGKILRREPRDARGGRRPQPEEGP